MEGNTLGITHVLNVSDFAVLKPGRTDSGIISKWVPIQDNGSDDVFGHGGGWWRCRAFLGEALEQPDGRVLVHCAVGVNRSATIVAAWLMETRGWSLPQAMRYLEDRRPTVGPVQRHLQQLEAFQRQLDASAAPLGRAWCVAPERQRLRLWLWFWLAIGLGAGLGCLSMAADSGASQADTGKPDWKSASCRVLAAGVDYLGTCRLSRDAYGAVGGNYTACGSYTWCADEGGTCECHGTVRYAARQLDSWRSGDVEREAKGSVECSAAAFGRNPSRLQRKQCFCRPTSPGSITNATPSSASCGRPTTTGTAGGQGAQSGCSHLYLPWALVLVSGHGPAGPAAVRCAYPCGLPGPSALRRAASAKNALAGLRPGSSQHCHVPVAGQASGSDGGCPVALEQPCGWAKARQQVAESRYSHCWSLTGLGFLGVAVAASVRLRALEARGLSSNLGRPLLLEG